MRKMKERPSMMRLRSGASYNPRALSQVGAGDILAPVQTRPSSGIELSRELCRMANMRMKPRGGFCVHAPAVEGIGQFESGLFTGVIQRSFLEHEWKLMELLGRCLQSVMG